MTLQMEMSLKYNEGKKFFENVPVNQNVYKKGCPKSNAILLLKLVFRTEWQFLFCAAFL